MKIQIPKAVQKPMMSSDQMRSSGQMRNLDLMRSLDLMMSLGLMMDSSLDNLRIRSAFHVESDSTMTRITNSIGTMKSTTNFLVKTNT